MSYRIVMLAPFGIRPKGTLLARMLPLAQALVRRGHQVTIVAPPVQNPEDAGTCVVYAGVPVIHTQLARTRGPLGVLEQTWDLLQTSLSNQPDLLHLFKPKGFSGLATLLASKLHPRLPLVVDCDDWEGWGGWNDLLPYPYPAKLLFAWQERDLPQRARTVTVASRTLQSLVWSFGVPAERVFYLPNGADLSATIPAQPTRSTNPTLLLYTRFWDIDLHDLIAAFIPIVQRFPRIRLLVVGKGERGEEQALLRLAERAGIGANIDYHGWAEPATIPALLARADIALVPMQDTLINRARCSAKLLELLAAGLPVVATRVGENSSYIEDGVNGLLTEPGNPAAFARAILQLLATPRIGQQLRQATQPRLQMFTWDALAPIAEKAYHDAATRV